MIPMQSIQLLLIGGVLGLIVGVVPTMLYFSKRGVDIPKVLDVAGDSLEATEPFIAVVKEALPGNKIVNTVDFIEKWAKIGVEKAQQLYHVGELTDNEKRKQVALDTVNSALKELGITPTDNQRILIDDVIEASVNGLGHKDKTEAEKEAEKQSLQAQLTQLTTENTNLKNAITAAANTIQVTV